MYLYIYIYCIYIYIYIHMCMYAYRLIYIDILTFYMMAIYGKKMWQYCFFNNKDPKIVTIPINQDGDPILDLVTRRGLDKG